jgi:alkylhydroperoxidase/carboxymuconolactone decarboxylase family protein YurZ
VTTTDDQTALDSQVERYKQKYGAKAIEAAQRLTPSDFPHLIAWRDRLDQHYTKTWLNFTYGGMFQRGILDDRTRLLVMVGECTVMGELRQLEHHIQSALANGATPREVLEVILQATIYAGYMKVESAAEVFTRVVEKLGRLDEIAETQLPLEGTRAGRTIEQERPTWRVPDEDFPEREAYFAKYGWEGISAGIRTQPTHHVQSIRWQNQMDQHFLKLWLDYIYAEMYTRGILDDKTRVLCMVGECVVLGEIEQAENHMRCAMLFGASPREVFEVLLQTTIYAGMPKCLKVARLLTSILEKDERLSEITDTQLPLPGME